MTIWNRKYHDRVNLVSIGHDNWNKIIIKTDKGKILITPVYSTNHVLEKIHVDEDFEEGVLIK